jgi:hypothetical protein
MSTRREFITLVGSAATAWPLAALRTTAAVKTPRISFLGNSTAELEANLIGPFESLPHLPELPLGADRSWSYMGSLSK